MRVDGIDATIEFINYLNKQNLFYELSFNKPISSFGDKLNNKCQDFIKKFGSLNIQEVFDIAPEHNIEIDKPKSLLGIKKVLNFVYNSLLSEKDYRVLINSEFGKEYIEEILSATRSVKYLSAIKELDEKYLLSFVRDDYKKNSKKIPLCIKMYRYAKRYQKNENNALECNYLLYINELLKNIERDDILGLSSQFFSSMHENLNLSVKTLKRVGLTISDLDLGYIVNADNSCVFDLFLKNSFLLKFISEQQINMLLKTDKLDIFDKLRDVKPVGGFDEGFNRFLDNLIKNKHLEDVKIENVISYLFENSSKKLFSLNYDACKTLGMVKLFRERGGVNYFADIKVRNTKMPMYLMLAVDFYTSFLEVGGNSSADMEEFNLMIKNLNSMGVRNILKSFNVMVNSLDELSNQEYSRLLHLLDCIVSNAIKVNILRENEVEVYFDISNDLKNKHTSTDNAFELLRLDSRVLTEIFSKSREESKINRKVGNIVRL